MIAQARLRVLQAEMRGELVSGIVPFWTGPACDDEHGGVVGLVREDGTREVDAPKGSVLHARVLWALSASHRVLGDAGTRARATHLAEFLRGRFVDPAHGGVYWMIDAEGTPRDVRKHLAAQAFAIYALSEHHRAAGSLESLRQAVGLFDVVEEHAHDEVHGGYAEAFDREWAPLDDAWPGAFDGAARKSIDTHLHVLEGYTSLYRSWPDALLRRRLEELLELFLGAMVPDGAGHVTCFFDGDWTPKSRVVSYGHDIETSWLIREAAAAIGDAGLVERARRAAIRIADQVLAEGHDGELGGLYHEGEPGRATETDKEWWAQAEAVVGFLAAYQETRREPFLDAALATWEFTRRHVIDPAHGEWRRRVSRTGAPRPGYELVGPSKCPQNSTRACLEVIARVDELAAAVAR